MTVSLKYPPITHRNFLRSCSCEHSDRISLSLASTGCTYIICFFKIPFPLFLFFLKGSSEWTCVKTIRSTRRGLHLFVLFVVLFLMFVYFFVHIAGMSQRNNHELDPGI